MFKDLCLNDILSYTIKYYHIENVPMSAHNYNTVCSKQLSV